MKKDIQIPKVTGVEIAVVYEYNDLYKSNDWNIYIINKNNLDLEMVVVVSKGFNETKETSVIRKKIPLLMANSFSKLEWVQPELFDLTNQFQVTFFLNNTLYDKTYFFEKNTVKNTVLKLIPELNRLGVLAT